jgi:predicted RNase H-like HicB family nuclease
MKLTVIVHEAIEGGYWAEVPAIPGCATEGDSWDELISNLHEAIEGCLSPNSRNCEQIRPTLPANIDCDSIVRR